jgi:hypothetical protein
MKFKRSPEMDFIDAIQIPVKMTIKYEKESCEVCPTDWFTLDITGTIRIYKDEVFKKAFISCE